MNDCIITCALSPLSMYMSGNQRFVVIIRLCVYLIYLIPPWRHDVFYQVSYHNIWSRPWWRINILQRLCVEAPLFKDSSYKMVQKCFFLFVSEQILHNIKQEYKRLQKRRHLDSGFQQADSCCPLDLQNVHSGPALAGSYHLYDDIDKLVNYLCDELQNRFTDQLKNKFIVIWLI